jgi:hypothetical protein
MLSSLQVGRLTALVESQAMLFRRGRDDAFRLGELSYSPSSVNPLDSRVTSQGDRHSSPFQQHHPDTADSVGTGYNSQEVYDLTPWQADASQHALEGMADSVGALLTDGEAAGNGGHGTFIGPMVDSDVAIYIPLNIAINAYGGEATATQIDAVVVNHHAGQTGGAGGGGEGNAAAVGSASHTSGTAHSGHAELSPTLHPETASFFGSMGHVGDGGDGIFLGAMLDMDVSIYAPINIAIGFGGNVTAIQYNSVVFDQGAVQVGGVGGRGGNGNGAVGDSGYWSLLHADTVHTGGGNAGTGGDGVFVGIMNDNDVGIYAPINIAIGGSTIGAAGPSGELHNSGDWPSDMMDVSGFGSLDLNHDIEMLIHDLAHPI